MVDDKANEKEAKAEEREAKAEEEEVKIEKEELGLKKKELKAEEREAKAEEEEVKIESEEEKIAKKGSVLKKAAHFGYKNFSLATFVVFFALIFHVADFLTGWGWNGQPGLRALIYLLLLGFSLLVFEGFFMTIIIGIFAWAGPPFFLNLATGTSLEYFASLFFLAFPAWPLAFFFSKMPETYQKRITVFQLLRAAYLI